MTKEWLASNLRALMEDREYTQVALARKAGLDQKTISNIINPDRNEYTPTLAVVEAIAGVFDVPVYQILIDELPLDLLKNHQIHKLVDSYKMTGKEGRRNVSRVAEREADYENIIKTKAENS